MKERELRDLIANVKTGRLSRCDLSLRASIVSGRRAMTNILASGFPATCCVRMRLVVSSLPFWRD